MNYERASVLVSPAGHSREPANDASVGTALEHVIEASERVVTDRMHLLRLELNEAVRRGLHGALFIGTGALLACYAWLALSGALLALLAAYLSLPVSLIIVALVDATFGGVLVTFGVRQARTATDSAKEEPKRG